MKPTLRLLALMLAALLLLAACAEDEDAAEEPEDDADVEEPEDDDEEEEADDDEADEEEGAEEEGEEDEEAVTRADADLVIWADDTRTPALEPFAEEFGADNDVEVVVQELPFDDLDDQLITAGPAGEGPDIIIGAHDWTGRLIENGVIAPIDLGGIADELADVAVEGFTFDGQVYGLPYATENLALVRNTELVPEAPETWDELIEVGQGLVEDGEAEEAVVWPTEPADPYHNYPVVTAYGGYVFGQEDDGSYDPSDLGLDNEGSIEAAEAYSDWVEEGILNVDVTYDLMIELFSNGDAPFTIAGPWTLGDFEEAGVDYEVTPIPEIDGGTPQPFVGVQGFMLSSFAENELLAQTFLTDYMATEEAQLALYDADPRPPAMLSAFEEVSEDPNIEGFGESGLEGQPMPNIPEMDSVWESWTDAYELIWEGSEEPDTAFTQAAEQIRGLIE
ncbi:MAG: maltose ABC transporter substrate-binding protein [Egibacteraceae bacterium]